MTAVFQAARLTRAPDCAILWDYCSLFQHGLKLRTPAEGALFSVGLRATNIWYGHALSVCWMQSELPPGFAQKMRGKVPPLAGTYEDSGWVRQDKIGEHPAPCILHPALVPYTQRRAPCTLHP